MGLLAFCANAAALSQGKWVAWPKCQGCARRLDGSDFTKAAGVAAPPSDGPDDVAPRVWAPSTCALRIFDGKEARACLRRRPLALVGDATTQGIFDELRLLAWDFEFPPGPPPAGLTYVQVAAGGRRTALLRSDGTAAARGRFAALSGEAWWAPYAMRECTSHTVHRWSWRG